MQFLVKEALGLGAKIAGVVSNRSDAKGLLWAQEQGLHTLVVEHKDYPTRNEFDEDLLRGVIKLAPDYVFLAGFMRVLRSDFVKHFEGRLLNIHPSLLPAFQGLRTHERALAAGVALHGASVHWVTNELDAGEIILQGATSIVPTDSVESLAVRVQQIEHRIYPEALAWILNDKHGQAPLLNWKTELEN